ncbi:unnamed protein product [Lactuca saligna]|uniref:Uncharacterized protein n=1 Tax=Lactuca saligna TaxID=75948 RepID=A0AA36A5M7_LACSI|nr:unnamed protein product [Lactuca saligna]
MGIWDVIYSIGDGVKGITPDLSTVKRAGSTAYNYTSATVTKINQVARVDGIHKLPQYWPQITLFTTTLAKNTAKYAAYEGFKHIPGATVATKLVSDTMREVQRQSQKDGIKGKVDRLEVDLRRLTPQQGCSSENGKLSSQVAVESGHEKARDVINMFMKTEFVGNQMFHDLMVPKIVRMEKKNE